MVGDERAAHIDLTKWKNFPSQEFSTKFYARLPDIINLINRKISEMYDFIFVFGFHWDFVCMEHDDRSGINLMHLRPNIDMNDLTDTVILKTQKWKRLFPETDIIWITPHPPDILTYNSSLLKQLKMSYSDNIMKKNFCEQVSKYWYYSEDIFKKLLNHPDVNVFSLNAVLFFKQPKLVKSFTGLVEPRFPDGFLKDGFGFTSKAIMYFGDLILDYLTNFLSKKSKTKLTKKTKRKSSDNV